MKTENEDSKQGEAGSDKRQQTLALSQNVQISSFAASVAPPPK